ncbi:MAG: P1 family peptidase [Chloroflexota bacterium]|nr:P1 family peptidase [Chloroflexota bacterium]
MNTTLTAVSGIEVGHYTDVANGTGCTVILAREGASGGVDVRGGSPGTRETDLLQPMHRVDRVHGVVLSGGSAYGLDAASGVMRYLEEQGIGVRVGAALVPIVASAILFDLNMITNKVRPGPEEGYAAALSASASAAPEGTTGAGTGATVGKLLGPERAVKGGIGSAATTLPDGTTVAALIAVNAVGDVVDHRTGRALAAPRRTSGAGFVSSVQALLTGASPGEAELPPTMGNTTIGVVATDATLTKEEANWVARMSHDGLALTIRPCHTPRDGDSMFVMASNRRQPPGDLTSIGAAAVEMTAQAVLRAVTTATGLGGIPSVSELEREG